ncbi:hypothetical protein [Brevibacillus migulae]|uniref:hypothetical protein n=1 Tax=Brevibacillus migulae TaxID=1644114 RepID=UPI00106E9C15|nr:hypothetical protein [Brevibacillus migulae]
MNYEEALLQLLQTAIRTKLPIGIKSYQYCLDEKVMISSAGTQTKEAFADITLYWEDSSLSRHRIALPFPPDTPLPIHVWQRVRYFDPHSASLDSQTSGHSSIACDQSILALLEKPFSARFSGPLKTTAYIHTRKLASSHGEQKQEIVTEALLQDTSPYANTVYHKRRLPNEQELTYLHEEQLWMRTVGSHVSGPLGQRQEKAFLLFSPDALRAILHSGFAALLTDKRKREHMLPFIRFCADHSRLSVSHDPYRPWSIGTRSLWPDGSLPKKQVLIAPALTELTELPRYYEAASLHVNHPNIGQFHQWLSQQEHVDYVPHVQVQPSFSPYSQEMGWVSCATRFIQGRPTVQGNLTFTFSLAALVASPHLTLIAKVGWDGYGLAIPYRDLVYTP